MNLPAKLGEQPDGGLLDKRVFGVDVGHGSDSNYRALRKLE